MAFGIEYNPFDPFFDLAEQIFDTGGQVIDTVIDTPGEVIDTFTDPIEEGVEKVFEIGKLMLIGGFVLAMVFITDTGGTRTKTTKTVKKTAKRAQKVERFV